MQTERALERLKDHQQQILALTAEGRDGLAIGDATSQRALALVRWKLMRALREYQLFKHSEIFDPILAIGPEPRTETARGLKAACIDMATAYDDHVRRWSLVGPTAAWDTYRAEARIMADRIERQLTADFTGITQLLTGFVRTRTQRPADPDGGTAP